MTTIEIMKTARGLIDTEEKWFQGWFTSPDGRKICAGTAIRQLCDGIEHYSDICEKIMAIAHEQGAAPMACQYFFEFNDTHTHAEVLAAFDATIARLESLEKP